MLDTILHYSPIIYLLIWATVGNWYINKVEKEETERNHERT